MEVYKKRLIKTIYNSYLIRSDIEGATIIFDNEEVGTINNGSFTYRIPQKTDLSDSHTISIKENTGTLYQKPTDYILSTDFTEDNRFPISNLANNITLQVGDQITSTKTTYTQSYPSSVTVEPNTQEIDLNTVQAPSTETVNITGNNITLPANHTTNPVQGEIEITQDESGKEITFHYEQAAGVQTPFIVNSDIEGATVTISNGLLISKEGTISQGSCQILFWQDEWEDGSMTALVSGSGDLLTPTQETYTFVNNTEDPVEFAGIGGDFNISEYWNITSTYGNTTYSYPSESQFNSSHVLTLNEIPYAESGTIINYNPTTLNLSPATSEVNSSITITQETSNKTLDLPYKQLAMALHTYTVYSDIEGATVTFGDKWTATVTGGQAVLSLYDNEAPHTTSVSISGGTLLTKETEYIFERNSTSLPNISADGESINFSSYINSYKIFYSSSYPSQTTIDRDSFVTMNTVISDSQQSLSFTPPSYSVEENETDNSLSYPITLTQTESNKTISFSVTQSAGVRYSYIVYSNAANGTSIAFNGSIVGQVNSSGTFTYYVWNSKAPASYSVSFPNGFGLTPSASAYTFNISSSSLSFDEDGGTKSSSVSSYRTDYSYNNPTGTVNRNSSTTINATQSGSNTNISYSYSSKPSWISSVSTGTNSVSLTASSNSNYSSRSDTVSFTQSTSEKTDSISVSQDARSLYNYTVYSNCNGGTVYFNNVSKGTISGGSLVFTDEASSGTVRISGGVPSNTSSQTDTDYDYDTDTSTDYGYSYNCFSLDDSTSWTFAPEDDGHSIQIACNTGTRTRSMSRNMTRSRAVYTNYNYSAPSNQTCSGNSSVTMNYSSSTSTSYGSWSSWSYGSWSYGSWSSYTYTRKTPIISGGPSWSSWSKAGNAGSGANSGYLYNIYVDANTGSSTRSGSYRISHPDYSSEYYTFSFSQQGVEYVFATAGTLNPLCADATSSGSSNEYRGGTSFGIRSYKKVGSTYTQLGISQYSGFNQITDYYATNGSTYGNNKGANTGWQVNFSAKRSPYVQNMNNPQGTHSYTVTLKQEETGRTLSVTVKQYDYYIALTNQGTSSASLTIPASGGNGGKTWWIGSSNGYDAAGWTARSSTSWLTPSRTSGNNGDSITANASSNSSTASRSGTISIGITGHSTTAAAVINVTQSGAASSNYGFYVKATNTPSTSYNYCASTSSVTRITNSSSAIYSFSGTTAATSTGTFITRVINASNGTSTEAAFTSATQSRAFKIWRYNVTGSNVTATLRWTTASIRSGDTTSGNL